MKENTYLNRCFELAQKGIGNVKSNPIVGCVIVADNRVIGEGWHEKYGKGHAEVNAVNSVRSEDKYLLEKACVYVSLEPCAHYGKTPPCCDLLIKNNVAEVVIACVDPTSKVNGQGIQRMKEAGINVRHGILEKEAKFLIRRFITFQQKKRPYIILKWAQSYDGFMGKKNEKYWITNKLCKKLSHKWRSEEQAILVGEQTILTDNPNLTIREWFGTNPIRIALQKYHLFHQDLNIFNLDAETMLFTSLENQKIHKLHQKFLLDRSKQNFIPFVLETLFKKKVKSLIVEGGQKILQSFIDQNLFDEVRVLQSSNRMDEGIKAPVFSDSFQENYDIGDNSVKIYYKS